MVEHIFTVTAVIQKLDNAGYLGELLFFPEIACFDTDPERVVQSLLQKAKELLEDDEVSGLYRRQQREQPFLEQVEYQLPPPKKSEAWNQPVILKLDVVRWTGTENQHFAYVPTLDVQVFASSEEKIQKRLPQHIRLALARAEANTSLHQLMTIDPVKTVTLAQRDLIVNLLTPKEAVVQAETNEEVGKSVHETVCTDLCQKVLARAFGMEGVLARMAEILTLPNTRSILLVGPSGVGKTAALYELVRKRKAYHLQHTPFFETSGSRIVAGMTGFGMWQERSRKLCLELSKKQGVLFLGNLMELFQVGRSEGNVQGIAQYLKPFMARGELQAVAECTGEQFKRIEQEDPHLLQEFVTVRVNEPMGKEARSILHQYASWKSKAASTPITEQGMEILDRLHRRYATYSAYPGRPIRFLRNLLENKKNSGPLAEKEILEAFSEETSLPLFMLDDGMRPRPGKYPIVVRGAHQGPGRGGEPRRGPAGHG